MRRSLVFIVALVLATIVSVPPAFAWYNGEYTEAGMNGYGTHDWVLDNAIRLAGPDGAWVETETALLATDDPDSIAPRDSWAHIFYERGLFGGAPQMVTDLYSEAVEAHKAGDIARASTAIGLLSHYYADTLNPFHSAADGAKNYRHNIYEAGIDDRTRSIDDNQGWVTPRPFQAFTDIRAKHIAAAAYSRSRFPALYAAYTDAFLDVDRPDVRALTAEVLSRAVNDLADIVRSVPTGKGVSPLRRAVTVDMSRHDPAQDSSPYALAKCLDVNGRPVSGARVVFTWASADGTPTTQVRYTDPRGVARNWYAIGRAPRGTVAHVDVVASDRDVSTSAWTWYRPTAAIAAGSAGIKTTVSNARPKRGTVVTARTVVHDTDGRHVKGLRVTFTWKYRKATVTASATTDAYGVARCVRSIGQATRGYRVNVTGRVTAGAIRSSTASFVPR